MPVTPKPPEILVFPFTPRPDPTFMALVKLKLEPANIFPLIPKPPVIVNAPDVLDEEF